MKTRKQKIKGMKQHMRDYGYYHEHPKDCIKGVNHTPPKFTSPIPAPARTSQEMHKLKKRQAA